MNLKQSLSITLLALAGLAGTPALADHEQHRHGQDDAAPAVTEPAPARDQDMAAMADKDGMDDMKSGGKSCKKCKKGMGSGGDSEAAGHDHGGDDGAGKGGKGGKGGMGMMGMKGMGGKSDTEALNARVRQLEKRLDLMQTMLEMLVERRGGDAGGGGHH